jgi:autoinducer 2 (AI-2) kinase
MPAEHLLAVDAGTSGARAVVLRPGAGVVASARASWQYETPPGGGPLDKAFDAEAFWSAVCGVVGRALREGGVSGRDIAGVGVTSQRLGIVVVDSEGRALLTSPNVDARAFMEGIAIDAKMAERVYASTGKLPSLLLAPARLHWLRKHDAAASAQADKLLSLGDWLAFRLTGEARNERALAGECGLLDIRSGERDDALLAELEVAPALLPRLVSSHQPAGQVGKGGAKATGLAAGTPVVIAGGDTQCALVGMGIEAAGEAGIAAGWSCPVQQVTAQPRFDPGRRTWVGLHAVARRWVVESSATDAGRMWQWWCETLLSPNADLLQEGGALAEEAPAGSGDVLALLGPAAMNAGAMGLHLGGLLMTTPLAVGSVRRPHLLRAALENIAYALRANLEQAEEVAGMRAGRIAVGGGLTRSPVFSRILADIVARPVEVAQDVEVTARGAAIVAARALGLHEGSLRAELRTLEPEAGAAAAYDGRYRRWRALGAALDRTMGELA